MKTLTLSYPHPSRDHAGDDYLVVQVEQSTAYKPGQMLAENHVKDLCEMSGMWKVIVKRNASK